MADPRNPTDDMKALADLKNKYVELQKKLYRLKEQQRQSNSKAITDEVHETTRRLNTLDLQIRDAEHAASVRTTSTAASAAGAPTSAESKLIAAGAKRDSSSALFSSAQINSIRATADRRHSDQDLLRNIAEQIRQAKVAEKGEMEEPTRPKSPK